MITHEEAYTRLVYGDKVIWHEKQFLEDYIRQNEQFAKDVARYFELNDKYINNTQTVEEAHERWVLVKKLTKGVAE